MARDDIFPAELLQKEPELLYQLVPDDDAQTVIDLPELINVEHQHTDHIVILRSLFYILRQHPHKVIAVIQPCQPVVICHVGQFLILCARLGNILDVEHLVRRLPVGIVGNMYAELHPDLSFLHLALDRPRHFLFLLKKKHFAEGKGEGLLDQIEQPCVIPHFMYFKSEIFLPLSQCEKMIFLKGVIQVRAFCGIADLLVHPVLLRQLLVHRLQQIQLIAQFAHLYLHA